MKQHQKRFSDFVNNNAVLIVLLILIVFFGFSNKTFLKPNNLINITSQMSINVIIATGITFVIITGGIDISVGSVAAFAAIFSTFVAKLFPDMSVAQGLLIQILSGVFIGAICGLFVGLWGYIIGTPLALFIATWLRQYL